MPQISFKLDDTIIPEDDFLLLEKDVLIDRGSRYGFCISNVKGKEDIKNFLSQIRQDKYYNSADHLSYAYRMRSPEGILVEGKSDDGETGAGLCILRELKRGNVEQVVLVISRHFGGVYLQTDRYKNIVDVSKIAIGEMK